MPTLNINTDAVVKFTNTLEKLHKSALPSAIRGALNDAVFDVKTKTMPLKADEAFKKRVPNFFKANSRFEKADGFNVNTMKATVGFTEQGLRGGDNFSVKDLEQQESGGELDKKAFIPLDPARVGKSADKPVRPNARLKKIRFLNVKNATGKSPGERFVKTVHIAGVGGFVLAEVKGKEILWRVDSINGSKFKLTALYSFKQGRKAHVKSTSFMKEASEKSEQHMEQFYIQQAERQIAKFR